MNKTLEQIRKYCQNNQSYTCTMKDIIITDHSPKKQMKYVAKQQQQVSASTLLPQAITNQELLDYDPAIQVVSNS
jgi:hypothetical protein